MIQVRYDTVVVYDTIIRTYPPTVIYRTRPTQYVVVYDTIYDTVFIKTMRASIDTIVGKQDTLSVLFEYPPPLFTIHFQRSHDSVIMQTKTIVVTKQDIVTQQRSLWHDIGIGAAGVVGGFIIGYAVKR